MRPSLSHPCSAEAAARTTSCAEAAALIPSHAETAFCTPSHAEAAVWTLDGMDDEDISDAIFAGGDLVNGSGVLVDSSDNEDEILGYRGGGVKLGGAVQTNNRPPSPNPSEYSVTDAEVTKFAFVERLCHFMAEALIGLSNHSAAEACIFMEVGTAICDLDTMKVYQMEEMFFSKYAAVLRSIPNNQFINESVQNIMLERYAAAKKINTGRSLFRKYKAHTTQI